jgi:hypothetical protein
MNLSKALEHSKPSRLKGLTSQVSLKGKEQNLTSLIKAPLLSRQKNTQKRKNDV